MAASGESPICPRSGEGRCGDHPDGGGPGNHVADNPESERQENGGEPALDEETRDYGDGRRALEDSTEGDAETGDHEDHRRHPEGVLHPHTPGVGFLLAIPDIQLGERHPDGE